MKSRTRHGPGHGGHTHTHTPMRPTHAKRSLAMRNIAARDSSMFEYPGGATEVLWVAKAIGRQDTSVGTR
eukprot:4451184-Pyramimonas_sp.AAC.1